MKVWIPQCGDGATLDTQWAFTLRVEHRNLDMFDALDAGKRKPTERTLALPSGCELVFDRIYVRQGNKERGSVTFIIKSHPDDALIGRRFWVPLEDVNRIDATPSSTDNMVGGLAPARYRAQVEAQRDPVMAARRMQGRAKRDELKAAKSAARAAFDDPQLSDHVRRVTDRFIDAHNPRLAGVGYPLRPEHREGHRQAVLMSSDPPRRYDPVWFVRSTRRLADGAVERDMYLQLYSVNTLHPAFTVTSRDGGAVLVRPLEGPSIEP